MSINIHSFIYTSSDRQTFNVDKYVQVLSCLLSDSEMGHGGWKMAQLFRTWEAV